MILLSQSHHHIHWLFLLPLSLCTFVAVAVAATAVAVCLPLLLLWLWLKAFATLYGVRLRLYSSFNHGRWIFWWLSSNQCKSTFGRNRRRALTSTFNIFTSAPIKIKVCAHFFQSFTFLKYCLFAAAISSIFESLELKSNCQREVTNPLRIFNIYWSYMSYFFIWTGTEIAFPLDTEPDNWPRLFRYIQFDGDPFVMTLFRYVVQSNFNPFHGIQFNLFRRNHNIWFRVHKHLHTIYNPFR